MDRVDKALSTELGEEKISHDEKLVLEGALNREAGRVATIIPGTKNTQEDA